MKKNKRTSRKIKNEKAILIQKIWRGYYIRKELKKEKDNFCKEKLLKLFQTYKNYTIEIEKLNKELKNKIRKPNVPEALSENLVKFILLKKVGICLSWNCAGDLRNKDIYFEIKCFSSKGPTSFGPSQNFSSIYFLDFINPDKINLYHIYLSSNSKEWNDIQINKKDTMRDQKKEKRRPRIHFNDIQKQINSKNIKLIFSGNITNIIYKYLLFY